MGGNVRILLLEDVWADAELGKVELRKAGLQFTARRVTTQPEFERALREFRPDLIIPDHNLPQFNGAAPLALARQMPLAAPFILLTGSPDWENPRGSTMPGQ